MLGGRWSSLYVGGVTYPCKSRYAQGESRTYWTPLHGMQTKVENVVQTDWLPCKQTPLSQPVRWPVRLSQCGLDFSI